jgi:hypothetical protein
MEPETKEKRPPAPYISWKTFTSFISNMHGKVPLQIDASVLQNMSGTARSQLLSALRFLDLIESDGTVKDSLHELSAAYNSDDWKLALRKLISKAYARVVSDLNISAATPGMLRDRFKNFGGIDGGTIESALRFYLSALKEAEIPYSPHLVVRQRAPRGSSTRKRAASKPAAQEEEDEEFEIPDGTFEVSLDLLGITGKLLLPEDLTSEQWKAVSEYVAMVIGLRQRTKGDA